MFINNCTMRYTLLRGLLNNKLKDVLMILTVNSHLKDCCVIHHSQSCRVFNVPEGSRLLTRKKKKIIKNETNEPCHGQKCICKNKGADQLRSNCEADRRIRFRYSDITF